MENRFRIWVGLGIAVFLLTFVGGRAGSAQTKSQYNAERRQKIKIAISQTQAQVVAAQQALAAATANVSECQAKISAAQGSIDIASESFKNAKSECDTSSQRMREIEESVLGLQPAQSAFAKAKAQWAEAKDGLDLAQDKILKSPEYKAKLQAAASEANKAEAIAALKSETLKKDLVYQRVKIDYDEARSKYDRERMALLEKNDEWVATAKAVREARGEQTQAEAKVQAGAMRKASASSKLRDASKFAAAASANVQQLTAALNSLQTSIGQKPTTPGATTTAQSKAKK